MNIACFCVLLRSQMQQSCYFWTEINENTTLHAIYNIVCDIIDIGTDLQGINRYIGNRLVLFFGVGTILWIVHDVCWNDLLDNVGIHTQMHTNNCKENAIQSRKVCSKNYVWSGAMCGIEWNRIVTMKVKWTTTTMKRRRNKKIPEQQRPKIKFDKETIE